MVKETKKLFEDTSVFYGMLCHKMLELTEPLKRRLFTDEQLCDIGYFCKEIELMLEEARKEVKARKELCGMQIAFNKIRESVADPSVSLTVRGTYATGTPDMKMQAALPKKMSDEYILLCQHLGVPREVAEQGVLKLDWNAATELCTKLLSEGKKIPVGFGKQYPKYETRFRKKKGQDNE